MKIEINTEITITSDFLNEIPHHIKLKIVEQALNQLQRAYVSVSPKNYDWDSSSKEKRQPEKFSYLDQSVLEFSGKTQDLYDGNER